MSNYIVNKEREKLSVPLSEENKEKNNLEILSIKNEKEKQNIDSLVASENKEKSRISSPVINNTKQKLSFSPLKIEEEKSSTKLPSYSEEIQKNKITLNSKLSEKKKSFTVETVITKIEKKSPTFSPLKIEEESKNGSKLDSYNVYLSKSNSNALAYSEPIVSKDKTPLFTDITEEKKKKEFSYENELIQKKSNKLYSSPTEEKSDYNLSTEFSSLDKQDIDLNTEFSLTDKEDKELEEFMLQNKELFGITGKITQEDKDKLNLIIPVIENLSTNGKIDPGENVEEKRKGLWGKAKDWLEQLLGFNLEIATLKSLLMPPELDKLLTDIKTFKGNIVHGNIIDSTVGGFNLANQLYNNISHFTLGEMAGIYSANFFSITGFKPSISIKNPGRSMFGNDRWDGNILMNPDDPFGSIENEGNRTFRRAGRFTDLRGLKFFGLSQIGNLFKGFKYNKDRWKLKGWKINPGNQIADDAKSNLTEEVPDPNSLLFGEEGDGWDLGNFKIGGVSANGVLDKAEDLTDIKKLTGVGIDRLKLNLDPGNAKANSIKEASASTLLNTNLGRTLKAIGVNSDKLSRKLNESAELYNKFELNQKISNDFINGIETVENLNDNAILNNGKLKNEFGRGYNIPSTNSPEDESVINLNLGSEMKEEDLNILRESIKQNFLSVQNRNNYGIGYMIVEPADFTGKFERFKIDFEFNPEIDEGSLKARYDTATILNRIGQLETYVGTDSMTASMKLKYRVLSRDNKKGNSWMSKWTLDYIQQIEMALRALTVPASIDNRTTRPPVLRIELGSHSNLFKFPVLINQNQKWRYFIATDVKINKFYDGSSYYLEDSIQRNTSDNYKNQSYNLYARDTMGFDADISLTEVKKSYFSYYPNFNDYYDSVVKNSNQDNLQYFLLPKGEN